MGKSNAFKTACAVLITTWVLSACQSTTHPPASHSVPSKVAQVKAPCAPQAAARLADLKQEIAALEKSQARGYRTNGGVIRVANPIKLCTSPIPFVSACLPQPKVTSTLPSYEDYKAERARLAALKAERDQMIKVKAACAS